MYKLVIILLLIIITLHLQNLSNQKQKRNMITNTSTQMARSSSSFHNSKHQTPIKSPSPDQARMNALTPTQVKYIMNGKNVKGYDLGVAYESCNQTPIKIQNQKEEYKRSRYSEKQSQIGKVKSDNSNIDYVKQLEKQIQILEIENRNLLRKLTLQKQNQTTPTHPSSYCTQPHPNTNEQGPSPISPSNANLSSSYQYGVAPPRRGTTQIIQKIKQQYEEKINTLKLMVEQEIKQAMGIIEDMCQILKTNLLKIEDRVESVEGRLRDVKIKRIFQIQTYFNRTGRINLGHKQYNTNPNLHSIAENSLSDILCVSIPQQQQEQSRNHTTTISKLQQQIQFLKNSISQTQKVYSEQKANFNQIVNQKNQQISKLTHQLEKSEQIKQSIEWKYNKSIKQQLILLQKNVQQLAQELVTSQRQCQNLTQFLEQKNEKCENLQRQVIDLKEKIFNGEKQKIYLEEKIRFLEGSISILEQQLKQRKNLLNQAMLSKTNLQKQRINKITSDSNKNLTQMNVLTLTSRIDKLLMLEQQRQIREKKVYFGELTTIQSTHKNLKTKTRKQHEGQNYMQDFEKGEETMMRSQR